MNRSDHQEFTSELVLRAYAMGIFPMGEGEGEIRWYSPEPRCIIDLPNFHAPRRLLRTCRQGRFDVRVNANFEAVIRSCGARSDTWITDEILRVYIELHRMGYAHSVETYMNGELVGGLYGVSIGGAFMGESMFHRATDASKVALVALVERLRARGFVLLDAQYMTRHLSTFGAVYIRRAEYLRRLDEALLLSCHFA